jgi:hypothetical protein
MFSERSLELPSGLNSFRRLLAYRLGQRFSLTHIISDVINNESGGLDKVVTLYRTPTTTFPRMLLIDYSQQHQPEQQEPISQQQQPQSFTTAQVSMPPLSRNIPSAAASMRNNNEDMTRDSSSPSIPGNSTSSDMSSSSSKKVLVMKRQTPSNSNNNKASDNKPSITAEDREKAYLEARARIFGTTGGEDSAVGSDDPNRVDSRNESRTDSPSVPVVAAVPNKSNTSKMENGKELTQTLLSKNDSGSGKFGKSSSLSSQQSGSCGAGERDYEGGGEGGQYQQQPSLRRVGSNQRVQSMNNTSNSAQYGQENTRSGEGAVGGGGGASRGKGKLVDVGSWVGSQNKSQLRNIEAEKSDPDFVRRGSPNVSGGGGGGRGSASNATSYSSSASSNYDSYGYGGYGSSTRGDVSGSGGGYPQYAGYTNYPTNAYGQPIPPAPQLTIGNYDAYPPQQAYMNDLYHQQQGSPYGYNPQPQWTPQQQQQYQLQQQQQQQYQQQRGNNSPYGRGTANQYGSRGTGGGNNSDVYDSNEFPPLA